MRLKFISDRLTLDPLIKYKHIHVVKYFSLSVLYDFDPSKDVVWLYIFECTVPTGSHLSSTVRDPYDARPRIAVVTCRAGIGRHPTDTRSMPVRCPVDVWMHKPAYICFPAPGRCVRCSAGHRPSINRHVYDDFHMPDVGTDFNCELKWTQRPSDAKICLRPACPANALLIWNTPELNCDLVTL